MRLHSIEHARETGNAELSGERREGRRGNGLRIEIPELPPRRERRKESAAGEEMEMEMGIGAGDEASLAPERSAREGRGWEWSGETSPTCGAEHQWWSACALGSSDKPSGPG